MKLSVVLLLLAGAVLMPVPSIAQEAAGRVLVAVGDVTIARGVQKIAAGAGTEVRIGDTVELGPQSSAQIRFTDESIVALRSGTAFRISEYAFQGRAPEEQRAFFDLLKGGLRTVTGIIGRARQDRYGVVTPTATIGIRGTHYTLVHCDNDCDRPAARSVANGTYGSVVDGRIAVSNKAGETVFGSDQFFFVANDVTPAQQLIGPPEHLKEVRATTKPKPGAQAPTSAEAQQASGGLQSAPADDMRVSSSVSNTVAIPAALTTNVFQPAENATVQGPSAILDPTFTGTVFYRIQGPFNIPLTCSNPQDCGVFTAGDITLGVNFTLQHAGVSVNVKNPVNGDTVNIGTPFTSQGLPLTVEGGQVTFSGTFNLADHPQNSGAFRCSNCGPNGSVGFLSSISFSGSISGAQATLRISGVDSSGNSGFGTTTLTQATPPNNDVAAIATPTSGGDASARSAAFWGVQLDSSRRLVDFGPSVGQIKANVGSATNTIAGSRPDAGNLVWGAWTGDGAQVTDFNYVTFSPTSTAGSTPFMPWITGTATNTLPPSLGSSVTYSPVGWLINNGFAVLNSGSITADFVNRTMSLNLDATRTSGEPNRFVMSGGSGFSSITGRFSAGFVNVQCVSGPCATNGNPAGGGFGGFFAGQQAEGAGVAFVAGFGVGNGVSGVVGFKR